MLHRRAGFWVVELLVVAITWLGAFTFNGARTTRTLNDGTNGYVLADGTRPEPNPWTESVAWSNFGINETGMHCRGGSFNGVTTFLTRSDLTGMQAHREQVLAPALTMTAANEDDRQPVKALADQADGCRASFLIGLRRNARNRYIIELIMQGFQEVRISLKLYNITYNASRSVRGVQLSCVYQWRRISMTSERFASLLCIATVMLCGAQATAAVMEVDSITTTPLASLATDTDDVVAINSVTAGVNTYTLIEQPTSVTLDANVDRFWAINGADPGSDGATLTDNRLDTGVLNPAGGVAQWGRTIGLNEVFVIMDFDRQRFDDFIFRAVDAAGNVIGDYSLTLATDDTPTWLYEQNVERESGSTLTDAFKNAGYLFTIGDMTGTTGDLSLATGLEFEDISVDGSIDPTMLAIVDVPEPASMVLLGIGGLMMRRRRP